ncbi:MAG TPA: AhpC/TSA family protein [Candidatus Coprenecus stercoravium]|uniref:AhpC/TSA family protein n=1 Tax=Candidatus Coprenecus stercoravium TaxID=2840735 RepID=A0A9D2GPX3_9BACT|nr:AhpC/TSA family protein [Candidatus Coprenecus stercoravium]
MKKLLFLAAAIILAAACDGSRQYSIKGKITGNSDHIKNGKVYLMNRDRNFPIRDTVDIVDGVFEFRGHVDTPEQYLVVVDGVPGMVSVYLENESYQISGTDTAYSLSAVTGGVAQQMFNDLNAEVYRIADKYGIDSIRMMLQMGMLSQEERESAMKVYETFTAECDSVRNSYIAKAPVSSFSLYFLENDLLNIPIDSAQLMVNRFKADRSFRRNRTLASMDTLLQKEVLLQLGMKCLDFTMNNPEGEPVVFSEIYSRNKVTMLDFWASWCQPCRRFNPQLVEIYKDYHDLGLEIVGVSLDRDSSRWVRAIEMDGLSWPQVSDLGFWDNAVSDMYNVKYIPQNVFVDSTGCIIGRKVAEDEIRPLLDKYLKD